MNFRYVQALMYVIITCQYEKDLTKNSWEEVSSPFSHYKLVISYKLVGIFQTLKVSYVPKHRSGQAVQLPHISFAPLFSQLYRILYAKSNFSYDAARIVFKLQKKVIHDTI